VVRVEEKGEVEGVVLSRDGETRRVDEKRGGGGGGDERVESGERGVSGGVVGVELMSGCEEEG
jgi:hypothetical protein